MIGFTPEGNVKVWINSNFALNELDINAFKYLLIKLGLIQSKYKQK